MLKLANALTSNHTLIRLCLWRCGIGPDSATALSEAVGRNADLPLEEIILSENQVKISLCSPKCVIFFVIAHIC